MSHRSTVVFSDLDGTLLDARSYTFEAALPGLERLRRAKVPLVICTSKSRAEIEFWRKGLNNHHPYILESGGGIVVPEGYFAPEAVESIPVCKERIGRDILLVLGTPYSELRRALCELRDEGFPVRGVGDMDAREFAELTGLPLEQSRLAKQRAFDEPFTFDGSEARLDELVSSIAVKGLRFSRGRLYHITGNNDKGQAVRILTQLYRSKLGDLFTIGLGDSPLDFPMFESVERAVLVQNASGRHDACPDLPGLWRVDGIGPAGWTQAILMLVP